MILFLAYYSLHLGLFVVVFFFPGLIILCSRSQSQSTTGLTTYNLVRHDLLMASGLWGRTESDTTEAT